VQRWARGLACAAIAALLAAGCGESKAPTPAGARHGATTTTPAVATPPHDDAGRAQFALVRRADVPDRVIDQNDRRNHAECSPRVLFRHSAAAIATTPRYVTARARVQQSVLLFRDAATAAAAYGRLDSRANRRCIAHYTYIEAVRRAAQALTALTTQTLLLEPVGQRSTSYRLSIPIPGHAAASDVLFNRIGRALSSVSVVWDPAPTDLAFEEALVRKIAARVRTALG